MRKYDPLDYFMIVSALIMVVILGGGVLACVSGGRKRCEQEKKYEKVVTDNGVEVEKMTTADSTTIYRVWDNGHYVYFTGDGHTEYTYHTGGGKMPRRTHHVTCN